MSNTMPMGTRIKLSAMMFLQFMILPVWFIPMFPYITKMAPEGSSLPMLCGMIMGFGALASPLFGMFADRHMNSEKVLALCNFVSAALLAYAYTVKSPLALFVTLLLVMVFYMPTWSLTATIAMANSTTEAFPQIRVFGTLGWVASAVFSLVGTKVFGIQNFDTTPCIFLGGAIGAVLAGLLAFGLPPTEPPAKGQPASVVDALGLRALVLLKRPDFLVFSVLILLAMVPFQWYNVYNSLYLQERGYQYLTGVMNLGQVLELVFMLLIPVILKKAGYKWAMVLGLLALVFRYGMFYLGASNGLQTCDFAGILIHGLIFGMLIVGSQMYVDAAAPAELRGQAQGFIGLIMFSLGTFLSNYVFDIVIKKNVVVDAVTQVTQHNWVQPFMIALGISLVLAVLMAVAFKPAVQEKKHG
ncbi:MAG TPA: MFS transporter [Kiritimatiellia bacterium]|nr:MFS transporter [Kiritimatiellia bacterium]HRU71624.1 MFS transporter [Kiritimatiellia bacterium]